MKKFLQLSALVSLAVILGMGVCDTYAATRQANINASYPNGMTSTEMLASNSYALDYYVIAGNTSRGDINYNFYGRDQIGTYTTLNYSGVCPVGGSCISTGFSGGTLSPLNISVDSWVKVTVSKGTDRNTYPNHIGSAMIYTPTDDVARGMDVSAYYDIDACREEMDREAAEMVERVGQWDRLNEIKPEVD